MVRASLALVAALVVAPLISGKPTAGTKGTVTAWEGGTKVIDVEACTPTDDGGWDYVSCSHTLREKVVEILCKRGAGKYSWGYQVGDEKPFLTQVTSCK